MSSRRSICCRALVRRLGSRATLHLAEGADHSFHVPARSGRKDADVRGEFAAGAIAMDRGHARGRALDMKHPYEVCFAEGLPGDARLFPLRRVLLHDLE
jgi:hypothetical protein